MAYKKLIKVSNVCQLLDKSKYRVTATYQGITFTNNDDGSWTVVGTAPDDPINHAYVEYSILTFDKAFTTKHFIPGHKIIVGGGKVENAAWVQWVLSWSGGYTASNSSNVNSYTITEYPENFSGNFIGLRVQKGQTVNLTFKPQLFDLTEMYGAGHEPTTVEQFRQDFPEEMYDYSPYSWLTSYKHVFMTGGGDYLTSYQRNLTCKTKNLFDYTTVRGLRNTSTGADISSCLIINGASFTVKYAGYAGPAHIFPLFILKAGTYTLSLIAKGTVPGNIGSFGIVKFNSDGTKTNFVGRWASSDIRQSYTFTLDEDSKVALDLQGDGNASNYLLLDSTFTNIQLELGNTATDYVPYGHL